MAERLYVRLDDDPLYAPETSVPTGTLREFPVPPELQPWLAHVIAYEEDLPEQVQERVLPDGSMHLIFELDDGPLKSRVAGPRLQPAFLVMQGQVRGLSVKLRPGAARVLFGAAAHELAGRAVAWDDLVGARDRTVPEQLHDARTAEDKLAILRAALQGMQRDVQGSGWAMARRAKELLGGRTRPTVQSTARMLGITERRLQQLFQDHVGLSPRDWRRLARLHDCLRLLRRGGPVCWASMAAECGFSDQSHLVREFGALCGFTPTQFLQHRAISGSFKTAA